MRQGVSAWAVAQPEVGWGHCAAELLLEWFCLHFARKTSESATGRDVSHFAVTFLWSRKTGHARGVEDGLRDVALRGAVRVVGKLSKLVFAI